MPDVLQDTLRHIVHGAFNIDVPRVEFDKQLYVLELFHGPTCAFKDFATRFKARLFGFSAKISARNYYSCRCIRRLYIPVESSH